MYRRQRQFGREHDTMAKGSNCRMRHMRWAGRRGRRLGGKRRIWAAIALAVFISCGSQLAAANGDPLIGILSVPGGAGLGFATQMERSPYRGGGTRNDLVPLYLYEGKHVYLHAY